MSSDQRSMTPTKDQSARRSPLQRLRLCLTVLLTPALLSACYIQQVKDEDADERDGVSSTSAVLLGRGWFANSQGYQKTSTAHASQQSNSSLYTTGTYRSPSISGDSQWSGVYQSPYKYNPIKRHTYTQHTTITDEVRVEQVNKTTPKAPNDAHLTTTLSVGTSVNDYDWHKPMLGSTKPSHHVLKEEQP